MPLVGCDVDQVLREDIIQTLFFEEEVQRFHAVGNHMAVDQLAAQVNLERIGRFAAHHAGFKQGLHRPALSGAAHQSSVLNLDLRVALIDDGIYGVERFHLSARGPPGENLQRTGRSAFCRRRFGSSFLGGSRFRRRFRCRSGSAAAQAAKPSANAATNTNINQRRTLLIEEPPYGQLWIRLVKLVLNRNKNAIEPMLWGRRRYSLTMPASRPLLELPGERRSQMTSGNRQRTL